jgi:hypothetical protein
MKRAGARGLPRTVGVRNVAKRGQHGPRTLADSVLVMLCGSNEGPRMHRGTLYLSGQGGSLSCASIAA